MLVKIESQEKEALFEANRIAMEKFRQSPLGDWSGTEKYIDHIFCAANLKPLEELKERLSVAGIVTHRIREDHFVDEIGVSHTIFEMESEDKLVLLDSEISQRIMHVFDLIKNDDIEYLGWKCSDSNGPSNSSNYIADNFIPNL